MDLLRGQTISRMNEYFSVNHEDWNEIRGILLVGFYSTGPLCEHTQCFQIECIHYQNFIWKWFSCVDCFMQIKQRQREYFQCLSCVDYFVKEKTNAAWIFTVNYTELFRVQMMIG